MHLLTSFLMLLTLSFVPAQSFANEQTQNTMREVLKNYVELIPYAYGKEVKNKKLITDKIKNLKKLFTKAKHDKMLTTPNYSPIATALKEVFKEIDTVQSFIDDDFFKYRLKKVTTFCVACHNQLPANYFPQIQNKYQLVTDQYIKKNKEKAYLAYFFRDYHKVLHYFKKEFYQKPTSAKLREIIKTYLINLNDKNAAIKYLRLIAKSSQYKDSLKKLAKNWIKDLQTPIPYNHGFKDLKKMMNTELTNLLSDDFQSFHDTKIIKAYQFQRILYDWLYNFVTNDPKNTQVPEALYWLALLEKRQNTLHLYSLSDLYLEECLTRYPKHPIAKKCYQTYKTSLYEGFTGSSGTNIPQQLKKKLEAYKAQIQK